MFAYVLPPIFVHLVFESLADIFTNTTGILILTLITIVVTIVVARRNHLTAKRLWSNILQLFLLWIGWTLLSSWYSGNVIFGDRDAVFIFVFTSVLFLYVALGFIIAGVVRRYAPAPFPILRAQLATILHRLAASISDTAYDKEQVARTKQISQSLDAISLVLKENTEKAKS